ncbi:type 4a pilus biogenesis protein PilO [Methylotenera sp.]|uniref:type 4a pilus biogenesis protein PilO n=1 Tax=Methylotenera sp. TaxID=2051956 RepID=UPI00273168E8|nr:type 4a pilus biogenesis protein PilO [Methylotenera sp.]MDP2071311.1 type 4a pilus biogenesis protein PilO [Methylotenera sp.]MDP3005228.1 type 4a pilus biogenesis protein PilO [Methylotenera sp.]MDP3818130.1 type 4a pilus biogenesis protein PilO [Methylotenera sp.]
MKKLDLYYFYWLLGRFAKALNIWGLTGIVITIGCLLFYIAKIEKLGQQITAAQYELVHIKENSTELVHSQVLPAQTSTQEINEFYKRFPAGASLPKWLNSIEDVAIKQHLILNRGDYKLSQTKQGQLLRYEIVLPLVGKYTQVRQFVAEVLLNLPALALSDLQIKRENSLSPTVEARLVFVLFLQGDSW